MKKILITGGAGFIGSNLTESFVNQGENVIVRSYAVDLGRVYTG